MDNTVVVNNQTQHTDTLHLAYCKFDLKPREEEITRLANWLKARIKADSLKMVVVED